MVIAARFHPNWQACSHGAKKLHARNVYQVMGKALDDKTAMLVCWTPGGKAGGGTGQAIRIAKDLSIPIYDGGGYDSPEAFFKAVMKAAI